MPELAEVEFYRKQWDPGLGDRVLSIELNPHARIFRNISVRELRRHLPGSALSASAAKGKQLLFQFSPNLWLGIHLGMTGRLSSEGAQYRAARHDHLVLRQNKRSLVFSDPRQFGRVRLARGEGAPVWWGELPPEILSKQFTLQAMRSFLERHRKMRIKPTLLLQGGFPGIGNWMADEVLWRAGIDPACLTGALDPQALERLRRVLRQICRRALQSIGSREVELPREWLFHERWTRDGVCPRHRTVLSRESIAGRTTVWCVRCQPRAHVGKQR